MIIKKKKWWNTSTKVRSPETLRYVLWCGLNSDVCRVYGWLSCKPEWRLPVFSVGKQVQIPVGLGRGDTCPLPLHSPPPGGWSGAVLITEASTRHQNKTGLKVFLNQWYFQVGNILDILFTKKIFSNIFSFVVYETMFSKEKIGKD